MNTKKVINIDSKYRKNYFSTKSTDFTVNLNYPITNAISMKLFNIQVANAWHNITNTFKNNTLTLSGYEFIIPNGSYNNLTLPKVLKELYSTDGVLFGNNWELKIDKHTGQSIIRDTNSSPFNIIFTSSTEKKDILGSLGWLLGFRSSSYSGKSEYKTEGVFNMGAFKYFYLVVDDNNFYGGELIIGNLDDTFLSGNILAIIRVNSGNYAVVNTDGYETQTRIYAAPCKIRTLKIKLIDPEGEVIDLNQMDFSFSLEFEIKNGLLP